MKRFTLSIALSSLILSQTLATDSLSKAMKSGKVTGEVRAFYIDRTYSGSTDNNRNAFALGGNLGYESGSYHGFSVGAKAYTTNGLGINSEKNSKDTDPSLFGDNYDSYSTLGEAYLQYSISNTTVKVGRQKLATPLAGTDDARMLPNLFEAALLINKDIQNTTLIGAHVTKMGVGTFANVYGAGSMLSLQSGYGLGYKLGTSGKFADMGEIALGSGTDTDGVTALAGIYSNAGLTLQLWDYYAHDILNAIYLEGKYSTKFRDIGLNVAGQYINQSEVGDELAKAVDVNYFGAKIGASYGMLSGYFAYSSTSDDKDTVTNGGVITPWGGMPAYTQGMVTRHQFFADTDAMKGAVKIKPIDELSLALYYVEFDIGKSNTYKPDTKNWTATEAGFDAIYQASKKLKLRFRGNFPSEFAPNLDWSEYRLIAYYNF